MKTNGTQSASPIKFDPKVHLNHIAPSKIYTMHEIGRSGQGISNTAVSEPFPLFTEAAIEIMRDEVLSEVVFKHHQYSNNITPCQLRGYAPQEAQFIYEAFNHPETLKIVSNIAGIDLVPVMDFEVGHVNVALKDKENLMKAANARARGETSGFDNESSVNGHEERHTNSTNRYSMSGPAKGDEKPIVAWHTDSYPFVCVLMLSDCSKMVGGETALRTGTGEVMKVRGPGKGHAVILQGRYIEHTALKAIGKQERVTMVTSYRPKSAFVRDDTVLTTVRSCSDLTQLYSGYAEYRLQILAERITAQKKMVSEQRKNRRFDTKANKSFLMEMKSFIEATLTEIVDDEEVTVGHCDSSHLLSQEAKKEYEKVTRQYHAERE